MAGRTHAKSNGMERKRASRPTTNVPTRCDLGVPSREPARELSRELFWDDGMGGSVGTDADLPMGVGGLLPPMKFCRRSKSCSSGSVAFSNSLISVRM